MNRNIATILAIAAAASTCNVMADDITVDHTRFSSEKSRAEVVAELKAHQKTGIDPWAQDYNHLAGFKSSETRAQVAAGYMASRAEVAALNSEDSGSAYFSRLAVRSSDGSSTVAGASQSVN